MRILHINKYNHEQDGVGRYMHDVIRLCEADGHTCAVLAMHHEKNISSPWDSFFVSAQQTKKVGKGIAALRQFGRAFWSYEAYKKTRAMIRVYKPDVIHAHNLYTHLSPSVLTAARHEHVPVVLTAHDYGYISANYGLFNGTAPIAPNASWSEVSKTKWIKHSLLATAVSDAVVRVQKACGMWTSGVACMLVASQAVKRALHKGGYHRVPIKVLPLPSGAFNEKGEEKNATKAEVLFASRFESYKGIDMVARLAKRMPNVAFTCIGQGSEEKAFRTQTRKLANVKILSTVPPQELWQKIREVSAVIVPSRWPEPFGLVALEALSLGTPGVVSNAGGLPEIVEHEISGFVVNPHEEDAWEDAIRALLPKNGKYTQAQKRMQESARMRGQNVGDPEKHKKALINVYEEAIHLQRNR